MTIVHHSLEDQIHKARSVSNPFLPCNITPELQSRVLILVICPSNFHLCRIQFGSKAKQLYLRMFLEPKPCNILVR